MPRTPPAAERGSPPHKASQRVKLKPQDSFDLIRLLARSQSDARKAVAELVQNSLDAGARRVEITWLNDKGLRILRIHDDGEGIFPGDDRPEALKRLAETIGHSYKRAMTPLERHRQMVLGKYGIGLLGFWSVARTMEIGSRVGGGDVWVLRLLEDEPMAEVFPSRSKRVHDEPTFTEIMLRGVKEEIARQVRPTRLQAYLASELRGQLLQRGTEVRIHDRIARGRAIKEFVVRPRAYLGLPMEDLRALAVPGHEDARVELYYVPPDEGRRGVVSLACGGSTVLDDIALADPTRPEEAQASPWSSGLFEGVIDFPELEVAPGTRRGFVPGEAALAFLAALEELVRVLAERVAREEAARAVQRREQVAREIRRAFAAVARRLPQYDLFDVRARSAQPPVEPAPEGPRGSSGAELGPKENGEAPGAPAAAAEAAVEAELDAPEAGASLFPPGPLAGVRVAPPRLRLAPSTERPLRAAALDADGRRAAGESTFEWKLAGPGALIPSADRAVYRAPDAECEAWIEVEARDGVRSAQARAAVLVRESAQSSRAAGIPEPEPVNAPSEPWRSRTLGERWQYNEGHRDFLAVREDDARRFRYLCHLFAKEVVLRNFGDPGHEDVLERMVEVLAYLGDGRGR